MLRHSAQAGQQTQVFTGVFVITWIGSTVVTLNSKLLGCNLSFFQCLCVLGYCKSAVLDWLLYCTVALYCLLTHGTQTRS